MSSEAVTENPTPGRLVRGLVVLVCLGWILASLLYPMAPDQGAFAWVADDLLGGGVLYRDSFELKWPSTYLVWALIRGLLGENTWGYRLADALLLLLGAWGTWRIGERWGPPGSGFWGAALLVLWYGNDSLPTSLTYVNTAQPDAWVGFALAAWLGWRAGEGEVSRLEAALAGALLACFTLCKPFFLGFGLLFPLTWRARGVPRERWLRAGGWLLGSFGLACALVLAWMHWTGALAAFVELHREYLLPVYLGYRTKASSEGGAWTWLPAFFLTWRFMPGVALPTLLGGAVLRKQDPRRLLVLGTWLVLGVLFVVLQGKYRPYHFAPFLPALALLASIGSAGLLVREDRRPRLCGLLLLAALCTFAVPGPLADGVEGLAHLGGDRTRAQFLERFRTPDMDPLALEEAAAYVREHSAPGDPLLLWGWNAILNALVPRPAVGRWAIAHFFIHPGDPELRDRYRREFLAAFDRRPPVFVALTPREYRFYDTPGDVPRPYLHDLPGFPELVERLQRDYRQVAVFQGHLRLLRRVAPPAPRLLER